MKKIIIIAAVALLAIPVWIMADPDENPDNNSSGIFNDQPDNWGMGSMCMGMGMGSHFGAGFQGMNGRRQMGGFGLMMLLRNKDEIGLTDEQVTKLRQLQSENEMERIDREAALKKARVELRGLMQNDKVGEAEVFKQIDKIAGLKAALQKMQYSHHQAMKGVLTAEQIKKIQDFHQQMRQNRRDKRGDRPMGQGQGRRGMRGHGM